MEPAMGAATAARATLPFFFQAEDGIRDRSRHSWLNRSSDLPLRLPLVPRNGCGRPGRAPERFLPLDITSLLLHVIFDARFLLRQYERQCFLRVQDRKSVV